MLKSVKEVEAKIRAGKPGRWAAGHGAYLQVSKIGGRVTAAWVVRYRFGGRPRHMGWGRVADLSLSDVRKEAQEVRKLLQQGVDPIEARNAKRRRASLEAARGVTFKDCAARFIASHSAGWKNPKHRGQWSATLETYADPVIGAVAAADVDTGMVLKVLEPIWATKPETASRVRGRIEAVLDWAKARGYREGENPARWRGHLDKLLPAKRKVQQVEHHAALGYALLPGFMADLREREGTAARALEFVILTAARTGEAIGARWSEIDKEARLWTVPADRMKGRRQHRVPLSDRAIEALEALPREAGSEFVFTGAREGKPLSNMALLMTLRRMGRGDLTAHGFRSSFRDWAAERTNYPGELVEMALAHVVSDKTEAAYRRGDMFDKRRRLMDDWSGFCMAGPREGDNVVPMRA